MPATTKSPRTIFLEAVENHAPGAWPQFLDTACGDDDTLRMEVERLLNAHARNSRFMDRPAAACGVGFQPAINTLDQPTTPLGTTIGRYKLVEQLGEGGMGIVYVAEQTEPIRRQVALKIIKPGYDTQQIIARFEAERQTLALMDHPNIARILDAGTTGEQGPRGSGFEAREDHFERLPSAPSPEPLAPTTGRPYFVMELVKGIPVTDYCDENHLSVQDRLQLFITVCQAVQHAHQKGIIHRDLKPSNVLVTMVDGKPLPKIIDFGVAKAISLLPLPVGEGRGEGLPAALPPEPRAPSPEPPSLHTGRALIGTPLYMSPEQANPANRDIDTRTDVYSLGVLLYELLTGTTPIEKENLTALTLDELRRLIREVEPETVAARIARTRRGIGVSPIQSSRHAPRDAAQRGAGVSPAVRNPQSPHNAASDTAPHASTNNIHATYVLTAPHSPRPSSPHHSPLSLQNFRELDHIASRALAKDRSLRYESPSALAADLQRFLHDEPVLACPPAAAYRLRKLARRNKVALLTTAIVAATLLIGIAVSTWQAIRATHAEVEARANEAKAILEGRKAADAAVAERAARQAEAAERGRAEAEAKRATAEESVALAINKFINEDLFLQADPRRDPDRDIRLRAVLDRAAAKIGNRFQDQPLVEAAIRATLGQTYSSLGEFAAAEPHLVRAHDLHLASLGVESQKTIESQTRLGELYQFQGRYSEAEPLLQGALEVSRHALGDEHPDTLGAMDELAELYKVQRRFVEAKSLLEKALETARRTLGNEHPATITYMNNLASTYSSQQHVSDAAKLYEEALPIMRRVWGDEHPDTLMTMGNLAMVAYNQNRFAEAIDGLKVVLERQLRVLGEEHTSTLNTMRYLGNVYVEQRRFIEAEPLLQRYLAVHRRIHGEEGPQTLAAMTCVCVLYAGQKRYAEEEALAKSTLEISRRVLGEEAPQTLHAYNNLAILFQRQGRHEEALPLLQKAVEIKRRVRGVERDDTLSSMSSLAGLYVDLGKIDEAEALYRETLELRRRLLGAEHRSTLTTMNNMAINLYDRQGRTNDAILLLEESLAISRRVLGDEHPSTLGSIGNLSSLYSRAKQYAKAEVLLRELLPASEKNEPDAWTTFNRKSMLGGALLGLAQEMKTTDRAAAEQKLAEAEPLLLVGYEGLRARADQMPANAKIRLREALQRLVDLYTAWDKPDVAAKWQSELAAKATEQPK